jgi:hypothetical protein
VLSALAEAEGRLPRLFECVPVPSTVSLDEARDHGRFGPVEQAQIFFRVRQQVRKRLAEELGLGV